MLLPSSRIIVLAVWSVVIVIGSTHGKALAQTPISYMLDDPNPEANGRFGRDVHIVDLNGDGVDELLIGASGKTAMDGSNPVTQAGLLYIKVGPVHSVQSSWLVIQEPSVTEPSTGHQTKPRPFDQFGFRIISGDFNADGYMDVAVSAPGVDIDGILDHGQLHWEQGEVFILYGPWSFTSSPYYTSARAIVEDPIQRLNSPLNVTEGDRFGWRIARGDPNNDGYQDLVIGSPFSVVANDASHFLNGQAYVYWGPNFDYTVAISLDPPSTVGLNDRLWGWDVACGNIVDIDPPYGDEVVVAAYNSDNPPINSNNGWVRVFRDYAGGPNNFARFYDITHPGGDVAELDFGYSTVLGKYDPDSYLDLAIGAPWETTSGLRGEVDVFLGGSGFPNNAISIQRPIVGSSQQLDKFGMDVDFLNDRDGDGISEMIIGAPFFYSGISGAIHTGPGRTYLRTSNFGLPGYGTIFDDPSPESTLGDINGWGSALAVGRLDVNDNLDFAIGDSRATRNGIPSLGLAGEVRVVIYQ